MAISPNAKKVLIVLALVVLVIRFRDVISAQLAKVPLVNKLSGLV